MQGGGVRGDGGGGHGRHGGHAQARHRHVTRRALGTQALGARARGLGRSAQRGLSLHLSPWLEVVVTLHSGVTIRG